MGSQGSEGRGDAGPARGDPGALLEAMPTPVIVVRAADARALLANAAAERLLGVGRGALRGRPASEFFVRPAECDQLRAALARDGAVHNHEVELRRQDGGCVWAAVWLAPLAWEGGAAVAASLVEVTAHRAAAQALRESEERYRVVVEAALEAIVEVSSDDVIEEWNPAAERIFGWTRAQALGEHASTLLVPPQLRERFARVRERFFATGEWPIAERYLHLTARHRHGHEFPVELSVTPVMVRQNYLFVLNVRDITRRAQLEAELRHSAYHDALTGLPNRAMFFDVLGREVARARRNPERRFALLYLDVDEFKAVNDRLGHPAGDQLLLTLAERLRGCMRATDVGARLGGDEFAVLAADLAEAQEAARFGGRLLEALAQPVVLEGNRVPASVSIGVALAAPPVPDPEELIRRADEALYRAKRGGKRRVEVHSR